MGYRFRDSNPVGDRRLCPLSQGRSPKFRRNHFMVAVSAPRHKTAFEACQGAVGRMKRMTSVTKREVFPNSKPLQYPLVLHDAHRVITRGTSKDVDLWTLRMKPGSDTNKKEQSHDPSLGIYPHYAERVCIVQLSGP